ncbi:MAG: hypothetical protein RL536_412 [Candidatus Parcubacteria bacterium]|jgi:hypothetical protein
MWVYLAVLLFFIFKSFRDHFKARKVERQINFRHNYEKYLRALLERREHEKQYGEDNGATRPRLQELLRIELGALGFLRNFYPRESDHLEISLRVLVKRVDGEMVY